MIEKKSSVFLSRIQLKQNPDGCQRLKAITANIEWDNNNGGCWIKSGSTAHSLAVILGFEPYDNKPIPDGTYDRYGRIK